MPSECPRLISRLQVECSEWRGAPPSPSDDHRCCIIIGVITPLSQRHKYLAVSKKQKQKNGDKPEGARHILGGEVKEKLVKSEHSSLK